jgi:hypothetical protein
MPPSKYATLASKYFELKATEKKQIQKEPSALLIFL